MRDKKLNILYILVEGIEDETFFKNIIKPILEKKLKINYIETYKYAQKTPDKVKTFFESIKGMSKKGTMDVDYIFVADIDNSPCVTEKKKELKERYRNIDEKKIIVVKKEIESWYIAGADLNGDWCKKYRIRCLKNKNNTDNLSKEDFNSLIPNISLRLNFISEILNHFSVQTAKQKNSSFEYFTKKYLC